MTYQGRGIVPGGEPYPGSGVDAHIQALVAGLGITQQTEALNAQNQAAQQRAQEQAAQENTAQVNLLCGRFMTWASINDIPKNSPLRFHPGWLLGETRDYSPSDSRVQTYMARWLLLQPGHPTRAITYASYSGRYDKPLPASSYYFPVENVLRSIAEYSHKHRVPWAS
jgi:hypothetical protein